jgi:hypothetical protein
LFCSYSAFSAHLGDAKAWKDVMDPLMVWMASCGCGGEREDEGREDSAGDSDLDSADENKALAS